ncbi:MAG: citrate lyase holo-[Clostridia bacterium]|nr:citrate lyase holo-[acyl-carrier protein] synthase [Clostridia bacterium]
MTEVTLLEMLEARERRVKRQQELLNQYRRPLVCFTMNIAGPVKTSPLIERAFDEGLCALKSQWLSECIYQDSATEPTGCTAFFVIDRPAEEIKEITLNIEETSPLGRLFDMDVLTPQGEKLSRKGLRGCIVCGKEGRDCAARRLHSVPELQAATAGIITDHFAETDAARIGSLAVESLLAEVHTTPKPGLVDERNCGSHKDMNLPLFERSAKTLAPYFEECVRIGQATQGLPPAEAFKALRQAGIKAEESMLRVTDGINTHKGAIYTLGTLCGALGRLWRADAPITTQRELLQTAAALTERSAAAALKAGGNTHGMKVCKTFQLRGIRGEVAAGLPSVSEVALPAYEQYLQRGFTQNEAGALTL